jgi:hypothetical protein
MGMRRMTSLVVPAIQYYSTSSHKRHYLQKKVIEHKMRVLNLCTILSATFPILRRPERDVIKNVNWSLCKVPLLLSDSKEA